MLLELSKVCSKGAIAYETAGTGSCCSSEKLEKTGHLMVKNRKLSAVCSIQKKPPRARDAETGSFVKGTRVSSTNNSLKIKEKMGGEDSRKSQYSLFYSWNEDTQNILD